MTYFKILSVALGSWMVVGGVGVVFLASHLEKLIVKLYPEVRPRWIPVAGSIVLALVLWTWMELWKSVSMENFVITLIVSLGLAKAVPMIFFYKKFRDILTALSGEPLAFRVVMLSSAAVGLALLVMGIFFK